MAEALRWACILGLLCCIGGFSPAPMALPRGPKALVPRGDTRNEALLASRPLLWRSGGARGLGMCGGEEGEARAFEPQARLGRREGLLRVLVGLGVVSGAVGRAYAEGQAGGPLRQQKDILKLKVGLKGLNFLLENWDEETIKCNYAEVPRELLETKNKAALLEAAKTSALFNKDSSMIIKCKRNPAIVREYLGLEDPEQALYRADLTIAKYRKRLPDPDRLEEYIEAEETWTQMMASADLLSFQSMKRDFAVSNDFQKGAEETPAGGKTTFLEKTRQDVVRLRDLLVVILGILGVQ